MPLIKIPVPFLINWLPLIVPTKLVELLSPPNVSAAASDKLPLVALKELIVAGWLTVNVPPLITTFAPTPKALESRLPELMSKAAALLAVRVPALTVNPPENVLSPMSVRVLIPALVKPKPAPLMTPEMVMAAEAFIVPFPVRVTGPPIIPVPVLVVRMPPVPN